MRTFLLMLVSWLMSQVLAAEWLMPGVHDLATSRDGTTCTVVVPSAIAEAKPMPVLFLIAPDGAPDAKAWSEWGDRRGCVVVGIKGLRWTTPVGRANAWDHAIEEAEKSYAAVLAAVRNAVPIHTFLRFIATNKAGTAVSLAMIQNRKEQFGGMLLLAPWLDSDAPKHLRKDVPMVMVVDEDNANSLSMAERIMLTLQSDGGTARIATVEKLGDGVPSMEVATRAMDWTLNIARVTHGGFTSRERKANLEEIAKQAQEIAGLVNPGARREWAGFLMAVPGMDKLSREYEQLADRWLESSIEIAKARETEDAVEAHAFLSIVTKSSRFKAAGGKQRKSAQTELARMRKNPAIRQEVAAADQVADICAMLDHDDSTAKQRIALKDLQAVLAQYPKTQAAKAAAKLVSKIQQNLR